jgi:hypothetical protein
VTISRFDDSDVESRLPIETCPLTSAVVMTSISTALRMIHMKAPSHLHVLADKDEELQDHANSCWPVFQFRHDLIPDLVRGRLRKDLLPHRVIFPLVMVES